MVVSIDTAGRLVVPKAIREEAGWKPGVPLEITVRDGCVHIQPVPREISLVKEGLLTVACPREPSEPLRADLVERTRKLLRERSE